MGRGLLGLTAVKEARPTTFCYDLWPSYGGSFIGWFYCIFIFYNFNNIKILLETENTKG